MPFFYQLSIIKPLPYHHAAHVSWILILSLKIFTKFVQLQKYFLLKNILNSGSKTGQLWKDFWLKLLGSGRGRWAGCHCLAVVVNLVLQIPIYSLQVSPPFRTSGESTISWKPGAILDFFSKDYQFNSKCNPIVYNPVNSSILNRISGIRFTIRQKIIRYYPVSGRLLSGAPLLETQV